ncbi:MAG TPA: hypothetical protein VGL86_30935 [Polyangia bacterium]
MHIDVQVALAADGSSLLLAPVSHCSPGSTTPLPQFAGTTTPPSPPPTLPMSPSPGAPPTTPPSPGSLPRQASPTEPPLLEA